ncbi:hypothetical protein XACM_2774 [Xanthomonas euvesicatoria pv. citrumelo F1]|nr:hypothetical protein XACM_2774 [Xanthomonas euvesicatoria pv. citrumelo F1]
MALVAASFASMSHTPGIDTPHLTACGAARLSDRTA